MEFILELIFDIIVEGSIELGSEKKVPMPLRILALLVVLILYIGFAGVLFFVGFDAMESGEMGAAILFYAVSIFILIGGGFLVRKMFRARDEEEEQSMSRWLRR